MYHKAVTIHLAELASTLYLGYISRSSPVEPPSQPGREDPRAQRARSTVGCTGEAADWVLALLPQSTSVIRSPARSGLRGRSTIVPCRSKTHSAVLSNFLSVSSRFIWPRSSAASFRAPLLSSSSAVADVCPSTVLATPHRLGLFWPFPALLAPLHLLLFFPLPLPLPPSKSLEMSS